MSWIPCLLLLLQAPTEDIFSGPQAGEPTPPFRVLDVSGPTAGKEVDYVKDWQGAPTVICFIHTLTRPGAQLMRRLDEYGNNNKSTLRTLFVSLTADLQATERQLPHAVKALNLKCPAVISLDGAEGPGAYGLNKEVLITVIAARDNKVVGNWAIVSPNETDFPRLLPVLDKLAEPALDTEQAMRTELLRLRAEVAALRAEIETLKRDGAPGREERGEMQPARGGKKRAEQTPSDRPAPPEAEAGKPPTDAKLTELLRQVIRRDSTPGVVDQALADIEAHVKDSADLKSQAVDALKLIDRLGYGNDYSRTARQALLGKLK